MPQTTTQELLQVQPQVETVRLLAKDILLLQDSKWLLMLLREVQVEIVLQ